MDQADIANDFIEQDLKRHLNSVLARVPIGGLLRTHCADCDDLLAPHRQQYGLCVPCKEERERRDRLMATGC